MNFVLILLVAMLVGSIACLILVPPHLQKIAPTGQITILGITFLGR